MSWTAPRLWPNQPAFILGGGPSLKATIERAGGIKALRARGRILAINNAYEIDPWCDCLYFNDREWLWAPNYHSKKLPGIFRGGLIVTQSSAIERELPIRKIAPTSKWPLSRNPQLLAGIDGGSRSVNLAYLFGANPIIALGFDMHPGSWHGTHKKGLIAPATYEKYAKAHAEMARELLIERIDVWNCSPETSLQCYLKRDIVDVLGELPPFSRIRLPQRRSLK